MQVSSIGYNQPYKISHKANNRWIFDKYGNKVCKTTTYYFRDDLDWENLIKFICYKYQNVPKVNFVNHACSNGMEPLSFLVGLMLYAPENVKKFTPILAKDINLDNILMAKKGTCGVSAEDFMRIHKITKGRYKDFFRLERDGKTDELFTMYPKEILTDKIIYEQGDIFKDIKTIPKDNSLLCCRNFWSYLTAYEREELAFNISKQLNPSSSVLIGYHDTVFGNADKLFEMNGFKRCETGNQFVNILYEKAR